MLGQDEKPSVVPPRKTFWRSVSWSDRSPSNPNPKTQLNSKGLGPGRSCLLPPLSISRRSVEEWPRPGSDDLGEWPHNPPATPSGKSSSKKLSETSDSERPPRDFQLKKDKLAFFDKECSRVDDHIYLGSEAIAKNRDVLRKNGITHVLNCVGFVCPEYFKSDLVYKTLWLQDSPSEDITSILYDVFDYFEDVREQGGRVLVHCCQGISRSTSLVIAYLMWRDGQSFEDAFQYVKAARGVTNPNMGFACQLLQCQKRVHAVPVSPSSVLRMYRMAPHSPYDPLHLVPKMLHNPTALGLDSRGAFIVHVPSAIYVWIGKSCNFVMVNNARTSASQVVRYERAQGQIRIVKEGIEPVEFWDALASGPPVEDDFEKAGKDHVRAANILGIGQRQVSEYDMDFDIFQNALSSGVVPPCPFSGTGSETHLPARENGWGKLRQKICSGVMKELVSVSKFSHESPSPPCGSPDSFSCGSIMIPKSSFKSPSLSPSVSDDSSLFTFSPASSNWSESTSSLLSPSALEFREPFSVKHSSLAYKTSSPSLAERRGGIPPSLTFLSPNNDDPPRFSKGMIKSWSFSLLTSEEDTMMDGGFHNLSYKDFRKLGREEAPLDLDWLSSTNEVKIDQADDNELAKLYKTSSNLTNFSVDLTHPVLFQWPATEKVDMLHSGVLDSRSVFFWLSPNVILAQNKSVTLYVWVGRDAQFDSNRNEDIYVYWEKIGCNFLKQIGCSMDTAIQIVREGEETMKFLDDFNTGLVLSRTRGLT
ncbi:hypothetical protein GIB67_004447 [Kingdonia uniflora]|uniref:Uncharacterized protein n=1 Tax=Kingdonia uniflora TaxID=39325 RepID=A0A7J7MRE7_9MAGN|nr:hypothetical protein GIB67_004447 [Kingdonia uniflora]